MFSIIIPAHNEEKYIAKCLESVLNLKRPPDFEVIVVDNASTDRTSEVVKNILPEAKIVPEPQKGLTRAYNRGAREARGDILVFIDADVILPADHLEKISREFERDKKLVVLSGPYIYKDGGFFSEIIFRLATIFLAMPAEIIFNRLLNIGASTVSGNSAARKEAFDKIGGFNEKMFYGLDADFAKRISQLGKVRFRFSFSTESSARRLKKEGTMKMLLRYCINIIWPNLFGKPFTKTYIDIR